MTLSHFIEILMILTKYVFSVSVRLTENSVTVESITLRLHAYWPLPFLSDQYPPAPVLEQRSSSYNSSTNSIVITASKMVSK